MTKYNKISLIIFPMANYISVGFRMSILLGSHVAVAD